MRGGWGCAGYVVGGVGCAGYVVQVAQAMWWPVQTNYIARLGLSQVSQSEPSVAIW